MKNRNTLLLFLVMGILAPSFVMAESINLSGRKDSVIARSNRDTVIAVANKHLGERDSAFLQKLDGLKTPFSFKVAPVQVAVQQEEAVVVIYDDASVLKVIAANFSKQVRGTLARSGTSYIQLQGGQLLSAGISFPARIPDSQDKTYNVDLIEVTSKDYTLKLGDATLTLTYSDPMNKSKNSVRKTNQ